MDLSADERRKPWCRQNPIESCRREAGVLIASFEDVPSGGSRQPERIGLLVKRAKSRSNESLADFPNLGQLGFAVFLGVSPQEGAGNQELIMGMIDGLRPKILGHGGF